MRAFKKCRDSYLVRLNRLVGRAETLARQASQPLKFTNQQFEHRRHRYLRLLRHALFVQRAPLCPRCGRTAYEAEADYRDEGRGAACNSCCPTETAVLILHHTSKRDRMQVAS